VNLEPGDRVLVTGATGFIGSAVTRTLLGRGVHVVALVEPQADPANLEGLDVKQLVGDIRSADSVRRAMNGCRAVFHVAALYRFWARDPSSFYGINVVGTRNVLTAAAEEDVERLVYTSTVGTLGLEHVTGTTTADERSFPDVRHLYGSYKRSKYVAEHEVLRAVAEGLPASLVLPTFPLGPGDRAPTPTGQLVLDFLNGRVPGYVDTVLNVAHVDDVAEGHVLALERGRTGRSYIVGGENLTLQELLGRLAWLTGLPSPKIKVPRLLSLAVAAVSETVEGTLLRRHPSIPLEAARMSTSRMAFDISRARAELGYTPRPATEALESSARWFASSGLVSQRRLQRFRWATDTSLVEPPPPPPPPPHRPSSLRRASL
jgi:dihydroflavonol-4-reductase